MLTTNFLVLALLLAANLGVDAKRSPRKTEKLYRKSGKWQRKLAGVWALLASSRSSPSAGRWARRAC